jgi:hypothetical protein
MSKLISKILFIIFRLIDTFLKVRETNQENLGIKRGQKKNE